MQSVHDLNQDLSPPAQGSFPEAGILYMPVVADSSVCIGGAYSHHSEVGFSASRGVPSCALTFLAPDPLCPLISFSPAPFASLLSQAPQPQGSELGGLVSVLPLGLTQSFSLDLSAKLKA